MSVQRIAVLGATGSIGESTLDVIARHPQRFEVTALVANRNWQKLAAQCRVVRPRYAAMHDPAAARALAQALAGTPTRVQCGADDICGIAAAPAVDTVVAAIVGAAGRASTRAAAPPSCCRSTASTTRSSSAWTRAAARRRR